MYTYSLISLFIYHGHFGVFDIIMILSLKNNCLYVRYGHESELH